ncbi:MAG TPA: TIGR00730 family Rossman fold protein [Actinomycetota bacterium]|nr:TIGR00730 family Rossman fold protein [Actinomycetota bacterium]
MTTPEKTDLDRLLDELFGELSGPDAAIAREIVTTAVRMGQEQVSRLDRKIANSALKEMRHAFKVFAPYKGVRKVTIFGSARTAKGDEEYESAREFSAEIAKRGWMVITGAGPGIMEAGHEGAGGEASFGVNIRLPFEAKPNPFIANDSKLINFKYFFTRKLTFMKEADAFVLLPGGFGTMDETFELLTLVQTGKSDLHPIVLLEPPGGTYWEGFDRFIQDELLTRGFISKDDLSLYKWCHRAEEAVEEIETFFRVYHSQRLVRDRLILRLNVMPDDATLDELSREFTDILSGPIERTEASPAEIKDNDVPDLPRIALKFDRHHVGRLRQLVDRLNEIGPEPDTAPADKGPPAEV